MNDKDYTDPANWPVGPLVGHRVRITTGIEEGNEYEVVSDLSRLFPGVIGVILPGGATPAAYLPGEYEEVES